MEKAIEIPLESFYENAPQISKQLNPTSFASVSKGKNEDDKESGFQFGKKYLTVHCKEFEQQQPNQQPSQPLHDETELFFASMAQCVKKLPPSVRAKLRMEIGAMVGAAEIEYYKNKELGDGNNDATTPLSNCSNFSRSYEDLDVETKDNIIDLDRPNDIITYLPWSDNN